MRDNLRMEICRLDTADLHTKILDCRWFDSSIISVLRGGMLMSMGSFPEVSKSSDLSMDNLSREIGRTCEKQER